MRTQADKAIAFRALHERDRAFIIPNPWDAGTARLLAHLGFGADLENGFGDDPETVAETIRMAADAGLAGGSIEDATARPDDPIYDFELAVERIRAAAEAARSPAPLWEPSSAPPAKCARVERSPSRPTRSAIAISARCSSPEDGGRPIPPKISDRLLWAVEVLAPDPTDHVLEIGCGTGVAAELILQKLTSGRLIAIDRSAAMIQAAERRNRASVTSGRARFWNVALEEAELGGERFDKVLAVHVNRFWLEPADESGLWAPLLKPGGVVCLVYQPPPGQSRDRIADACSEYFHGSGFSDVQVLTAEHLDIPAVCVRASDYRS